MPTERFLTHFFMELSLNPAPNCGSPYMRSTGANDTPGLFLSSTTDLTITPSISSLLPVDLMSQTTPVIPPSSFQSTFSHALRAYKKRTREDLLLHPLAARLQSCHSPDAILAVLQEQAQAIDQFWNGKEKLITWLDPIVRVVFALSSSLGEGIGLVIVEACLLWMYA